jgi:hypothetical protein
LTLDKKCVELVERRNDEIAKELEDEVDLGRSCNVPFDLDVLDLVATTPSLVRALPKVYRETGVSKGEERKGMNNEERRREDEPSLFHSSALTER